MHSTAALATIALMSRLLLASGSPTGHSSKIPISFPTGAAAVTAAPPVPTFGSNPKSDNVDITAALGSSNVVNDCSFPVYLYSCDQSGCGTETSVAANGGEWSVPFTSNQGDGVSIKIGTEPGEVEKPILQLEYTNSNGLVSFDASQINGNPFSAEGYFLGDTAGLQEYCAPPCTNCPWVYYSGEDGTVFDAANSNSIGFTLCSSQSN